MKPRLLEELSRVFDIEARDAVPVRILNGKVVPPSNEELREQQRLTRIASELRHRADAGRALRVLGFRP